MEVNELKDMVHLFHIESKDFDPDLYLDTIHQNSSSADIKLHLKALKSQLDKKATIIELLVQAKSPIVLECFGKVSKINKDFSKTEAISSLDTLKEQDYSIIKSLRGMTSAIITKKEELDQYILLRGVEKKAAKIQVEIDKLSHIVRRGTPKQIIISMKGLNLDSIIKHKNLLFFRDLYDSFEKVLGHIINRHIDKIDLRAPISDIEIIVSLYKLISNYRIVKLTDDNLWDSVISQFMKLGINGPSSASQSKAEGGLLGQGQSAIKSLIIEKKQFISLKGETLIKKLDDMNISLSNTIFILENIHIGDQPKRDECEANIRNVILKLIENLNCSEYQLSSSEKNKTFTLLGELYLKLLKRFASKNENLDFLFSVSERIAVFIGEYYRMLLKQEIQKEIKQQTIEEIFASFVCEHFDSVMDLNMLKFVHEGAQIGKFIAQIFYRLLEVACQSIEDYVFLNEDDFGEADIAIYTEASRILSSLTTFINNECIPLVISMVDDHYGKEIEHSFILQKTNELIFPRMEENELKYLARLRSSTSKAVILMLRSTLNELTMLPESMEYFSTLLPEALRSDAGLSDYIKRAEALQDQKNTQVRLDLIDLFISLKKIIISLDFLSDQKLIKLKQEFADSLIAQYHETFIRIKADTIDYPRGLYLEFTFLSDCIKRYLNPESTEKVARIHSLFIPLISEDKVDVAGLSKRHVRVNKLRYTHIFSL